MYTAHQLIVLKCTQTRTSKNLFPALSRTPSKWSRVSVELDIIFIRFSKSIALSSGLFPRVSNRLRSNELHVYQSFKTKFRDPEIQTTELLCVQRSVPKISRRLPKRRGLVEDQATEAAHFTCSEQSQRGGKI